MAEEEGGIFWHDVDDGAAVSEGNKCQASSTRPTPTALLDIPSPAQDRTAACVQRAVVLARQEHHRHNGLATITLADTQEHLTKTLTSIRIAIGVPVRNVVVPCQDPQHGRRLELLALKGAPSACHNTVHTGENTHLGPTVHRQESTQSIKPLPQRQ